MTDFGSFARTRHARALCAGVALGAALSVRAAGAQPRAASGDCAPATMVELQRGVQSRTRGQGVPETLRCPKAAGEYLATQLVANRSSHDRDLIKAIVERGRYIEDASLFHAAIETARDRRNSAAARVGGFVAAMQQLEPDRDVPIEKIMAAGDNTLCPLARVNDWPRGRPVGVPLRPDAESQLRHLALDVRTEAGAPLPVRVASQCARVMLRAVQLPSRRIR